jgi:hypothetical protein
METLHISDERGLPKASPEDCHGSASFASQKRAHWARTQAFGTGELLYGKAQVDLMERQPLACVKVSPRPKLDRLSGRVDCTSDLSDMPRHSVRSND